MSATVCLCTYNGERYLAPLLASLAGQSMLPNELLVGDDGSSDRTLAILEGFSARANFKVEILRSDGRLGVAANLERLLARAHGDFVFPCDQDDVWHADKLARLVEVLDDPTEPPAVVCDSALIDAQGRPLPGSRFEQVGFAVGRRAALREPSTSALMEIVRCNVVASHALGLRRSALDVVLPFGARWQADWWMALVLSGTTGIAVVDECLVDYRLHAANAVGLRRHRPLAERLTQDGVVRFESRASLLEAVLERLDELGSCVPDAGHRLEIEARAAHLRTRGALPSARGRRLRPVFSELRKSRYQRFSNGWRSAVSDLVRSGRSPSPRPLSPPRE